MNRKVKVNLSVSEIDKLIAETKAFKKWQKEKTRELMERLATLGVSVASLRFSRAIYTGDNDVQVTAKKIANGYVIRADGEAALFIEFGSGITYGGGHPTASEYGMGMGTYPSIKGHWKDPAGWHLPKDKGGEHTYGNPPAMAMYEAEKTIEQELVRIVKEVFV